MPFVDELFEDADNLATIQFMQDGKLILETKGLFFSAYETAALQQVSIAGIKPEVHLKAKEITVTHSEYSNEYILSDGMEVNVDGRTYYINQLRSDGSGIVICELSTHN